jgi:hypothetical protein
MTFEEAAIKADLEGHEVGKRISELLRQGFLEIRFNSTTGRPRKRIMSKGKPGRVQWITKKGMLVVERCDYEALAVTTNHRVRNTDPETSDEAIEPNSLLTHSMRVLTAFYEQHREKS